MQSEANVGVKAPVDGRTVAHGPVGWCHPAFSFSTSYPYTSDPLRWVVQSVYQLNMVLIMVIIFYETFYLQEVNDYAYVTGQPADTKHPCEPILSDFIYFLWLKRFSPF